MKPYLLTIMVIVIGLLSPAVAVTDTIYRWTDDRGVERFSNDPPPQGINNFEKLESHPSPAENDAAAENRRSTYDRMVDAASEEAGQLEQERKLKAAAQAAKKKRVAEALRKEKIRTERKRLEQKIEALKKRALSPTYSQGMKQAQIKTIKTQIEQIEKSP